MELYSNGNDILRELVNAIANDHKIRRTSVDTNYAMLKAEHYLEEVDEQKAKLTGNISKN